MTTPQRIKQAHRQAPWRIQTQRATVVLILAILVAAILGLMLNVTVQAGAAGLQIQFYESDKEELQRQIASLRTQYADLTSAERMRKMADEMGFQRVTPADLVYMLVPEFPGREPIIHPAPVTSAERRLLIKPVYTESLWEWLMQGVTKMSETQGGGTP